MISAFIIPIAFAILTFTFAYITVNTKNIRLLEKTSAGFTLIFLVLMLFSALSTTMTGVELADYELNTSNNQSLIDLGKQVGTYGSVISIIIWPLVMYFAGSGIMWVLDKVTSWSGKR